MVHSEQIGNNKPASKTHGTKLPMKTKIAAWWIITAGVVGTIVGGIYHYHWLSEEGPIEEVGSGIVLEAIFIIGVLYLAPGIFLLMKTKSAWVVAMVLLSLGLIASSIFYTLVLLLWSPLYFPIFFLYLVPLILIISDQKNYWKMTYRLSARVRRKTYGEVSG